ncbi:MAG TPA: hypothetical protein VKU94_07175 [Geobacterales bacterium]|nr:hypothetical protein [Geobacterales bacterium]
MIQEKIEEIEREVKKGNFALRRLGFWDIIDQAKKDKEIALKYGRKLSEINRYVFEQKWRHRYPPILGIVSMTIISLITIAFFPLSATDKLYLSIYFPIASFILSASLHPVIQYAIGRSLGVKFLYFYLRGIYIFSRRAKDKFHIEPALKVDYESHLMVGPLKRAIVHVSGAILTIIVVFFFFWLSLTYNTYIWSQAICGGLAFSYLLTEIIYSPKYAAWKHFLEEFKIWKELKKSNRI